MNRRRRRKVSPSYSLVFHARESVSEREHTSSVGEEEEEEVVPFLFSHLFLGKLLYMYGISELVDGGNDRLQLCTGPHRVCIVHVILWRQLPHVLDKTKPENRAKRKMKKKEKKEKKEKRELVTGEME